MPTGSGDLRNRKGKKVAYEPNPKRRTRIDRDFQKRMSRLVKEWHTRTKIPVLLLTFKKNAVWYDCSKGLDRFAKSPIVQQEFVRHCINTVNKNQEKAEKPQKKDVDFPVGEETNYEEFTVPALRKMVSLAIKLDGRKTSKWNDPTMKPSWWPEDVAYRNVNWGKDKPHFDELVKIMEAFNDDYCCISSSSRNIHRVESGSESGQSDGGGSDDDNRGGDAGDDNNYGDDRRGSDNGDDNYDGDDRRGSDDGDDNYDGDDRRGSDGDDNYDGDDRRGSDDGDGCADFNNGSRGFGVVVHLATKSVWKEEVHQKLLVQRKMLT
ncbi:putative carbonic anhydrase 2 [Dendronephthya gigantea]|uniref:putative carbonic anhydrase 2 n=1 Tax=Dendronephthya gigantea TaxID=151771 RepID=UPI00106C4C43|nr:putative carbonic anhydrase 2 [Dendronephthya gigantea]